MSYPYLLAQLPTLRFSDTDFPSYRSFMEQAEKWLPEEDFAILKQADLNDYNPKKYSLEILNEWSDFENRLRRDVANYRESHRLGHDHKTNMFPTSFVKDENPLDAELKMLKLRWNFLAERRNIHYDDLHALFIYSIKLQILERKAAFDKEKGRERFEKLTDITPLNIDLGGFRWQKN